MPSGLISIDLGSVCCGAKLNFIASSVNPLMSIAVEIASSNSPTETSVASPSLTVNSNVNEPL